MSNSGIRVDFYVLAAEGPDAALRCACRLAEKAFQTHAALYMHTDSPARARELDERLWTFRPGSFIPHALADNADDADAVLIGHAPDADVSGDVLINLAGATPVFFDRFGRVAEIVDGSEHGLRVGRQRFAFYQHNGYAPNTHKIA